MSTTTELTTWLNGTVNGGPNGDGRYPLTAKDGTVFLVYCPAAQALNPALAEQPVEVFSEQAQAAASTAASSASSADAARIAAATSAANAQQYATDALASKNAAATSATNAATSKTDADTAKTAAEAARTKAQDWADKAVDSAVETGKFSARHWAQKAADSAGSVTMGSYYTKVEADGKFATLTALGNKADKATTLAGYGITDAALAVRQVSAGNGLTGGGDLSADRTISLGTPSNIDVSSGNTLSSTSHTHALRLNTALLLGTDAAGAWPNTLPSITEVSSQAGWPTSAGTALTAKANDARLFQLFAPASGGTAVPDLYLRASHTAIGGGGWTAFYKVHHAGNFDPTSKLDAALYDSGAGTPNTIAGRNGSGDIHMRLPRTTYPDESGISGGLVFRVNNTDNNYLRCCSSNTAVRGWLGFGTDAARISISNGTDGLLVGAFTSAGYGAIYHSADVAGSNNYALACGAGNAQVFMQAATKLNFRAGGNTQLDIDGTEIRRKNANTTAMTRIPRIFMQPTDPGAAAADGDLWIW